MQEGLKSKILADRVIPNSFRDLNKMSWDPETPPAKLAGRKFRMTGSMTFETALLFIRYYP
jgi:hypothetical protein